MKFGVTTVILSGEIVGDDLKEAIVCQKTEKEAGADGILPKFLHNIGPQARQWLATAYTKIRKQA